MDIMHIVASEKGKPPERRGRKTTGLRALAYDSGAAKMNTERGKPTKFDDRRSRNSRHPVLRGPNNIIGRPGVHLECK